MRTRKPERTNEKKKRITLLGVIANGSTSEARKLLKKYDQPDATNHEDLEYKLTKLYYNTPDKLQIEKELSEIHPHKEFILKYNKPEPNKDGEVVSEKFSTSQASGCRCNQIGCRDCEDRLGKSAVSNACGCSSFDAMSFASGQPTSEPTNKETGISNGVIVLGVLGIITIFALTIKQK